MPTAPVIIRPLTGRLVVKLPSDRHTTRFIRYHLQSRVQLAQVDGARTAKRDQLNRLTALLAGFYGGVEVQAHYRIQVPCTPSCQNAVRDECVCSCEGNGHKGGIVKPDAKEYVLELGEDEKVVTRVYARAQSWRGLRYDLEYKVQRALGIEPAAQFDYEVA